jgi:Zn-dependent peptidase ImmA (M78 family)/DNA-binding XRE family transcriptional regulator
MISGDRLKLARELRGLTQSELAKRVEVTQASIAQIEGGRIQPSEDLLQAIALQTGFRPSFFKQAPPADFPLGSLLFRKRAAMTATEEKQTHRFGQLLFDIAQRWSDKVHLPPVRFPRDIDDPEDAARATRSAMGLSPSAPITNVIDAIERAGVWVILLPLEIEGGDAFSAWAGPNLEVPLIALWRVAAGDRLRMSASHELGHLVLPSHRAALAQPSVMEDEAYRFASEFLMPAEAMREEMAGPVTLTSLAQMKPRWGVSIQALVRRAYTLGIINKRQYSYLFEQLSARGWRMREPVNLNVPVEKPRAFRKIAELLYGNPIDYRQLATDFGLPTQLAKEIVGAFAAREERFRATPAPAHRDNLRHIGGKSS